MPSAISGTLSKDGAVNAWRAESRGLIGHCVTRAITDSEMSVAVQVHDLSVTQSSDEPRRNWSFARKKPQRGDLGDFIRSQDHNERR